ncbi:MAG: uroporphyrinogen decarboxylase family protein [Candidatus Bathyarchaeia archaeon]
MTPKEILRNYFESGSILRPLLIPLIFSYAAKLQKVDLKSFYTNPTILTNTLYNAWKFFRYDGIINYIDETLELEALGCRVDWCNEQYIIVAKPQDPENLTWKNIKERGRIPIAIEVIRRLKVMVKDECIIIGVLRGPFSLLNDLDMKENRKNLLQRIINTELEICQAYCEAGADLILILEKRLPSDEETLYEYMKDLVPLRNVANFFEARLILSLKEMEMPQALNILQDSIDGMILGDQQNLSQIKVPLGLSISNDLLYDGEKIIRLLQQKLEGGIKPFILTTKEEVHNISIYSLKNSINALKSLKLG